VFVKGVRCISDEEGGYKGPGKEISSSNVARPVHQNYLED
jgi:hypothetical protein